MALIGIWTPLIRLTVEIKLRQRESAAWCSGVMMRIATSTTQGTKHLNVWQNLFVLCKLLVTPQVRSQHYRGCSLDLQVYFKLHLLFLKLFFMALIGIWTPLIRLTVELKLRQRESAAKWSGVMMPIATSTTQGIKHKCVTEYLVLCKLLVSPQVRSHHYHGCSWDLQVYFKLYLFFLKLFFMALIGIWTPLIRLTVQLKQM